MRRALAALLMLVFSFPLIAPAFVSASPDESSLPACCRRNGQHHCAMNAISLASGVSKRYVTIAATCPWAPFAHVALMLPHALSSRRAPAVVAPLAGPAAVVCAAEAGYRISFHRSRQKRGPPQLLAL